MKKSRLFTTALCAGICLTMCGCGDLAMKEKNTTTTPQATVTGVPNGTTQQTVPPTDYNNYVATTVLPENYLGIEVETATESEVEAYIQAILEDNEKRELKTDGIVKGDVAIIDYAGYVDGEALSGLVGRSVEIIVGESGFVEGFDEGLQGIKKGESVSLALKFPEDYFDGELAGKDVVFEVEVHSIASRILPEFTDEFVTTITGGELTSTEALRTHVYNLLSEEKRYLTVVEYLVNNTFFGSMDEERLKAELEREKWVYVIRQGYTDLASFEEEMGADSCKVLWNLFDEQLRTTAKQRMALYCIATKEQLVVTEEQFMNAVAARAKEENVTTEEYLAKLDKKALMQDLLISSALELLLDRAVVKEEK